MTPDQQERRKEALDQAVRHYGARPNQMPDHGQVVKMAEAFLEFLEPTPAAE